MSVTKHKSPHSLESYDSVETSKKVEMGKEIAKHFQIGPPRGSMSLNLNLESDLLDGLVEKKENSKKMKVTTSWGSVEIDL